MKDQRLRAELFAPKIDWEALCEIIPDLRKLDDTPQYFVHHTEGDVGIHTRMCLDELRNDARWQALSADEQYACLLAVLMHDIAKPQKTVHEDDGRITSKGHSAAGNTQARGILWRLGVDPVIREFACRVAHYHQLPFYLSSHSRYEYEFRKLSLVLPLRLLSICSRADASGRLTTPPETRGLTLDAIDVFDLFAQELGLWDKPMVHAGISERGLYLEKSGEIDPSYAWPTANKRGVAFVMCGPAGMGKSTVSAAWDLPVIGLDWAREELDAGYGNKKGEGQSKQLAQTELKAYLAKGSSVVFDATNLEKDKRDRLCTTINNYKADCIFVHVEAPEDVWLAQNKGRGDRSPSLKTLHSMVDRWGAPLGDEGNAQVFYNEGKIIPVWGALDQVEMHKQLNRAQEIYKNPLGKPIA
jgi:predicted kinase